MAVDRTVSEPVPSRLAVPRPRAVRSLWTETWRRFSRHRLAIVGVLVLTLMVAAVLVGPFVYRVPIDDIDFKAKLKGPSWAHPLGTDDLGQDLLARMLYGGRISLAVGVAAMLIAISVGTAVGAVAGHTGGWIDHSLMRMTDLFLSLPQLPLLLLIVYLFRDILKKLFGPEAGVFILIVAGTIDVAAAIIAESSLSFLGLGFPPDIPTWGRILFDAKDNLDFAPHWAIFPGTAIFLTVLSINYIGDGLRDALDPRKVLASKHVTFPQDGPTAG
jgi:peptide/nickel transport system permease protein